jgi:hypothetical protein
MLPSLFCRADSRPARAHHRCGHTMNTMRPSGIQRNLMVSATSRRGVVNAVGLAVHRAEPSGGTLRHIMPMIVMTTDHLSIRNLKNSANYCVIVSQRESGPGASWRGRPALKPRGHLGLALPSRDMAITARYKGKMPWPRAPRANESARATQPVQQVCYRRMHETEPGWRTGACHDRYRRILYAGWPSAGKGQALGILSRIAW